MPARETRGNTPQIYVADLAAYNRGYLHGKWIDATKDGDDIRAEIDDMLGASPFPRAEEWAIHDYEGFGSVRLSENEDIDKISQMAQLIEEHGEVFIGLLDYFGTDEIETAAKAMEQDYAGAFDSLEEWAESFANDNKISAETYRSSIDWERVGRDAELGGEVFTIETADRKVHVFWQAR